MLATASLHWTAFFPPVSGYVDQKNVSWASVDFGVSSEWVSFQRGWTVALRDEAHIKDVDLCCGGIASGTFSTQPTILGIGVE